jgi:hypothetical protein
LPATSNFSRRAAGVTVFVGFQQSQNRFQGTSEKVSIAIQHSLRGFYETAGVVKVFAFAFVFSLLAFLFLLLFLPLSLVRVVWIHLGLLYALSWSCCELGA